MLRIVGRDIENGPVVPTKRDLSLAYSVASERAGKKSESPTDVKRDRKPDTLSRREFEIEQESTLSIP